MSDEYGELWHEKVDHALFGNGERGLVRDVDALCARMDTFIAVENAKTAERERAEKRHGTKLNVIIAIGTLVVLAIGAVASILALHANETRSLLEHLSNSQYQYTVAERMTK